MKKGLRLFLAASLAFSVFSSAALAATELTPEEKYQALVEEGIFEGFPDGQAHLDQNMTRAQAAKIVTLILGLEENAAGASIYTDLADAEWAVGYIGAATAAGILEGRGNGIFDPSSDVTIQELAKIMVEALDIEYDQDAVVEGADEWAGGYVQAAVAAGLIPEQEDYTVPASRELLVVASYAAYEQVKKEQEQAELSAKPVGAKKVEVQFGKAVDPSEISISMKKGNNTVNLNGAPKFADDNKSAIIETTGNLTQGEYTVTVTGLVEGEALTTKFTAENQRLERIVFQGDKASFVRGKDNKQIEIYYTLENQYGENANRAFGGEVTFTFTKGSQVSNSDGRLVLEAPSGSEYYLNEKVTVYALHTSGKFAQQEFTVSAEARVADIEIKGLYHKDGKTPVQGQNASDYMIEVVAKDQYGRDVDVKYIGEDTVVSVSNTSLFDVARDSDGNAKFEKVDDRTVLRLANPKKDENTYHSELVNHGKGIVLIMSKIAASRAEIEITVEEKKKVAELTLSAPDLVVAGETVDIPFTAVDQDGNELGKATDYDLFADLKLESSAGTLKFEPDYVADTVKLKFEVKPDFANDNAVPAFISGTVNNKFVNLQVTVNPKKKAVAIVGLKDKPLAIAEEGDVKLKAEDILIEDQYSRVMGLNKFDGLKVTIESDNKKAVTVSADELAYNATSEVVIKGIEKGESKVTFSFDAKAEEDDYVATFKVVSEADIVEYEIADVPVLYATTDKDGDYKGWKKELKVEGKLADGSKVAVPNSERYYKVSENIRGVEYDDGFFYATVTDNVYNVEDVKAIKEDSEKTFSILVTAHTKDGWTVYTKELTVSRKAPEITTLVLTNKGENIRKAGDKLAKIKLSAARNAELSWEQLAEELIDAKDQYDVNVSGKVVATAMASGISDRKDLKAGDTFNLVVITTNNKHDTIKVVVVENNDW